jgi:hypothetical protein
MPRGVIRVKLSLADAGWLYPERGPTASRVASSSSARRVS